MVDFLLPKLHENIRVNIGATAYHSWLVSEWHSNYASGYVLMYSPLRPASWKHAEVTARALVKAGDHQEAMQAIGGSILLIAVDEPTTYFRDKVKNGGNKNLKIFKNFSKSSEFLYSSTLIQGKK
jgi:hypothetical protein